MKTKTVLVAILMLAPAMASAQVTIKSIINTLISFINPLIVLTIGFALLVFIWGLAKFIWHSGDKNAVDEGRRLIIWGVLALFVMVSIWGIVAFVQQTFLGNMGSGGATYQGIIDGFIR
jgi:heme/copper-type cytochrome/quinol oxidase subunit 2